MSLSNRFHLTPNSCLSTLGSTYFSDGFPLCVLPNELPELYERALDSKVFWKLDLSLMSETQRAALSDWYGTFPALKRPDLPLDYCGDTPALSSAAVPSHL